MGRQSQFSNAKLVHDVLGIQSEPGIFADSKRAYPKIVVTLGACLLDIVCIAYRDCNIQSLSAVAASALSLSLSPSHGLHTT